ncbi:MAG: helix-turn-helix domain-containing protein [Eubacteriales bacterium]
MTLGEKLASLRKAKGYTQDEVAEKLCVTPQAVSKWKNDGSCPDITVLPILADLYETTTDDILRHENTPVVTMVPEKQRKSFDEMVLRVLVDDGGDKVKVNLPLGVIKIALEAGIEMKDVMKIGDADMSKIDAGMIIKMVESGMVGRLVEVEEAGGGSVVVEVI